MTSQLARHLRKNQTVAERKLWSHLSELRKHGYHFRRQAPLEGYIVDFACLSQRLVIEVDGAQHDSQKRRQADSQRDAHLRWLGFSILRFTNSDMMDNVDACMLDVLAALGVVTHWE
ncbi:MAG: endonuclease domain-containing protein [Hyphomicrobiaceae bacterium]